MRHFYVGVEHLFIALLEIPGGLAASILEDHSLTANYVIDAIRRKIGKGGETRLWAGMPNTPRANIVLGIANDLALEAKRQEINERDLLHAILEEGESIAIHVLQQLGLDVDTFAKEAASRSSQSTGTRSFTQVVFGANYEGEEDISDEQIFILRRMFYNYGKVRVERRLAGGYTNALLLVVTPIQPDDIKVAPVVVKIDHADNILDEVKRYEAYVKDSLPPLTARIEDGPTAPETSSLAGVKYTFISDDGVTPQDLRYIVREWGAEKLGKWLETQLFPYFGRTWWQQNRSFRFQAWEEYDWLLPPLLTIEYVDDPVLPPDTVIIKDPVRRAKLTKIEYGQTVAIENFTVQKVLRDRKKLQLSSGRNTEAATRAYKIEVRDVDFTQTTYYRGEIVGRLVGRVFKTRDELLRMAASALQPRFDIHAEFIPGIARDNLPNPLRNYDTLLDYYLNGSLSKIHGDLHLGNMVVGPGNSPFLIDFAHTREGHTLSDWAMLEVSLLNEVVMPEAGSDWDAAYRVLGHIAALNSGKPAPADDAVAVAMKAVASVREIARKCLHERDKWVEYYVPLAFCALRGMTWETMPLGSRRLMLLLSGLAMKEIHRRERNPNDTQPDFEYTETGETDTEGKS